MAEDHATFPGGSNREGLDLICYCDTISFAIPRPTGSLLGTTFPNAATDTFMGINFEIYVLDTTLKHIRAGVCKKKPCCTPIPKPVTTKQAYQAGAPTDSSLVNRAGQVSISSDNLGLIFVVTKSAARSV